MNLEELLRNWLRAGRPTPVEEPEEELVEEPEAEAERPLTPWERWRRGGDVPVGLSGAVTRYTIRRW